MPVVAPSLVGEDPAGDAIAPGKEMFARCVVEATPDGVHHIREGIFYIRGVGAAPQVALEWLQHLSATNWNLWRRSLSELTQLSISS